MDEIAQLTNLILTWRALIRTKDKQYQAIKDPLDRIVPAIELIHLRMELNMMEDEYAEHFLIPTHLYECNTENPNQA